MLKQLRHLIGSKPDNSLAIQTSIFVFLYLKGIIYPPSIFITTVQMYDDRTWTHEREWRWPLPGNSLHVPGLPLFLDEYYGKFFSEILIFVETGNEKNKVLNYLKTLHDSGSWNNGIEYDTEMIKRIKVSSIEDIVLSGDIDLSRLKIDNIPFSVIDSMPEISVSTETLTLVTEKLAQAIMLAEKAMIRFREDLGFIVWTAVWFCRFRQLSYLCAVLLIGLTDISDSATHMIYLN